MKIESLNKKNKIIFWVSFFYFILFWILFIADKFIINKYASIKVVFAFDIVMTVFYIFIAVFFVLAVLSILKLRFFYFLVAYKKGDNSVYSDIFLIKKIKEYSKSRLFLRTLTKTEKKAFLSLQVQ